MKLPSEELTGRIMVVPNAILNWESLPFVDKDGNPKITLKDYIMQAIDHELIDLRDDLVNELDVWLRGGHSLGRQHLLRRKLMARGLNPDGILVP